MDELNPHLDEEVRQSKKKNMIKQQVDKYFQSTEELKWNHYLKHNYKLQINQSNTINTSNQHISHTEKEYLMSYNRAFNKYCRALGVNLRETRGLPFDEFVKVKAKRPICIFINNEEINLEENNIYYQKFQHVEMLIEKGDLELV